MPPPTSAMWVRLSRFSRRSEDLHEPPGLSRDGFVTGH